MGLGGVEIVVVVVVVGILVAAMFPLSSFGSSSSSSSSSSSFSSSSESKETSASFSTQEDKVFALEGVGSPNASSSAPSASPLSSLSLLLEGEDSQTGKFEDAKIVTVSVLAYVAASMTRAHRNSLAHDFLAFLFISSSSS